MAYDLIIENGTVVDGTGAPRYRADVAVVDGVIAEIGQIREGPRIVSVSAYASQKIVELLSLVGSRSARQTGQSGQAYRCDGRQHRSVIDSTNEFGEA